MAISRSATRLIGAAGFALAVAVAPAVALAAPTSSPVRALADDGADCTTGESLDAYSLSCVPDIAPNTGGAPGEMQLTESNPGIASPTHGGR